MAWLETHYVNQTRRPRTQRSASTCLCLSGPGMKHVPPQLPGHSPPPPEIRVCLCHPGCQSLLGIDLSSSHCSYHHSVPLHLHPFSLSPSSAFSILAPFQFQSKTNKRKLLSGHRQWHTPLITTPRKGGRGRMISEASVCSRPTRVTWRDPVSEVSTTTATIKTLLYDVLAYKGT